MERMSLQTSSLSMVKSDFLQCFTLEIEISGLFEGIASPNKRPTLFDVFRRKGSDGKKDKEAAKLAASDRDSNSSGGSHGLMAGVKAAIMSGKSAEAPEPSSKKAVKDGSAHPHAGSDARVSRWKMLFLSRF